MTEYQQRREEAWEKYWELVDVTRESHKALFVAGYDAASGGEVPDHEHRYIAGRCIDCEAYS